MFLTFLAQLFVTILPVQDLVVSSTIVDSFTPSTYFCTKTSTDFANLCEFCNIDFLFPVWVFWRVYWWVEFIVLCQLISEDFKVLVRILLVAGWCGTEEDKYCSVIACIFYDPGASFIIVIWCIYLC